MKITSKNYFVSSEANFRVIPVSWTLALLKGGDQPVRLGNQTFLRDFTSKSPSYGSVSVYWISTDGTTLIRVSDHWSTASCHNERETVNRCKSIRKCFWRLCGRAKSETVEFKDLGSSCGYFAGGIVRFRDMKWSY